MCASMLHVSTIFFFLRLWFCSHLDTRSKWNLALGLHWIWTLLECEYPFALHPVELDSSGHKSRIIQILLGFSRERA